MGFQYYNIPSSMENCSDNYPNNAATQVNAPSKIAFKHLKVVDNFKKPQSYIPFIFKNKKIVNSDKSIFPSPGQYNYHSEFCQMDSRELIKQQYNILMENTKKIKQSVNFKSTAKRFNYKQQLNQLPLSYDNSPKSSFCKSSQQVPRKVFKKIWNKSMSDFNSKNGYPSIPDKSVRFGYTVGNEGKLNKIEKTLNQLDKERDAMKIYTKKLKNEKKYRNESDIDPDDRREELQVIEKLREKVKLSMMDTIKAKSIFVERAKHRMKENSQKVRIQKGKQSGNKYIINKIMTEKKNLSMHLGPGSYQIKDKLFGHHIKAQKFQFFCSTSERFPSYATTKNEKENYQQQLKKMEIQKKIYISKKSESGKMFQRIRKPQRFTDRSELSEKQKTLPGPGDYNPSENITKVKVGKVSPFDKSARFEENKQNYENQVEKRDISKQLAKQNLFVMQSRHNNRQAPKYPEVMQKNKEILRNKKELIQQSYKKYKTRGQSQYSICSWQSRPFSRNQHLPSALKQSIRIQ